ncbi:hypothetical protein PR048_003290 [Dryococelus australis]|uniref:Uncharacterized protein n=1 Tax=Dryococelus australis TaxID=614101 RepID=A0ABQ9IMP0_9NEOP|nr:hypothetical protein PR048_003290 [Dryococelus australis]
MTAECAIEEESTIVYRNERYFRGNMDYAPSSSGSSKPHIKMVQCKNCGKNGHGGVNRNPTVKESCPRAVTRGRTRFFFAPLPLAAILGQLGHYWAPAADLRHVLASSDYTGAVADLSNGPAHRSASEVAVLLCSHLSKERRVLCLKAIRAMSKVPYKECQDILDEEMPKRRMWVRKWSTRHANSGASSTIMSELYEEDPREFKCVIMTPGQFDELLKMVTPLIQRPDTIMCEALPAKVKFEITLAFLASRTNCRMLSLLFRVSKAATLALVPEVCEAIRLSLKDYMKSDRRGSIIHSCGAYEQISPIRAPSLCRSACVAPRRGETAGVTQRATDHLSIACTRAIDNRPLRVLDRQSWPDQYRRRTMRYAPTMARINVHTGRRVVYLCLAHTTAAS